MQNGSYNPSTPSLASLLDMKEPWPGCGRAHLLWQYIASELNTGELGSAHHSDQAGPGLVGV